MRPRHTFFCVFLRAAALTVMMSASPARAEAQPGPAPQTPGARWNPERGLSLHMPSARFTPTQQSAAGQDWGYDDPVRIEHSDLRPFLGVKPDRAPFAPMAGVIYTF